jgi:hypothetical protein
MCGARYTVTQLAVQAVFVAKVAHGTYVSMFMDTYY